MKAGNVRARWTVMAAVILTLVLVSPLGVRGQTQTPTSTCANDSLYLISPQNLEMTHQVRGREGLLISWRDLNVEEATCTALVGTEDLDHPISVVGGFADKVDRQLVFTTVDSGVVGSTEAENVVLTWASEGSSIYGSLGGAINLSNNGGLLSYSAAGGWSQENAGLPMTWQQVNIRTLAVGSDDFKVAAFSGGQALTSDFQGLFVQENGTWVRIAEDLFTADVRINAVAVSPHNNSHFAVATENDGLFITTDGGQTFQQWMGELDPGYNPQPSSVRISALTWGVDQLWAFAANFGLFHSADNGSTFQRSDIQVDVDLDHPGQGMAFPSAAYTIRINPSNSDHVLIGLAFNGVFQSLDGGATWTNTYGDLQIPDPAEEGAWSYSANAVLVDPSDANIMVAGMMTKGLFRTADGGQTWTRVDTDVAPENMSLMREMSLEASPTVPGTYYAVVDQHAVLVSTDFGVTWDYMDPAPMINKCVTTAMDSAGNLHLGTWGGGNYVVGTPLSLSATYGNNTSYDLRTLDLGLDIIFEAGLVVPNESFTLKCQTFQGWAVWRAPNHSPDEMTLIGLFDRVNPESCIEGYCGDTSYEIVPECYNSKRAACFDFDTPDSVRFFDGDVFNGFSYYYAVSSYDYGNTALSSPQNNSQAPVYSPRWENDGLSPFAGAGNRTHIQLNNEPTFADYGPEIYVFPNPLRANEGLPGQEGETVVFTNLPANSRVWVFTTAGDIVADLGPELMNEGNIEWNTRNKENESVSPGVYMYKVEMPSRQDHWGRLVIIR